MSAALLGAVSITFTLPSASFVTWARLPFGVTAAPMGLALTAMVALTAFIAVSITPPALLSGGRSLRS
ncbi:hypothetical protein ACWCXH_23755 [Kitasatospora sp. NPDC001660]